jgi:hypothetical protein
VIYDKAVLAKIIEKYFGPPTLEERMSDVLHNTANLAQTYVSLRTAARREASTADVDRKLAAIRSAVRHAGPTGPIERLGTETERGYLSAADPGGY